MNEDLSFQSWIASTSARLHQCFVHRLENMSYPAENLQKAMAYAVLGNGKRIRPLLVYATGHIFDAPLENLDLAATAVELIHSYSLVHDDLPAMDNASLRRGKLSCFKVFGEDIGILAGDALQTLAFEILTTFPAPLPAEERLEMVRTLSMASGASGMVSGQALDMLNTGSAHFSEKAVLQLYQLKTGALLQASIKLGILAAMTTNNANIAALEKYAENIALAFQIQDDILDIEGQDNDIGKSAGLDQTQNKNTYPRIVGLQQAKEKVQALLQQAFTALNTFGSRATYLIQLTEYIGHREK